MLEERRIYLDQQEDYANGFYARDLLTKYGKLQDLKVPRERLADFRPVYLALGIKPIYTMVNAQLSSSTHHTAFTIEPYELVSNIQVYIRHGLLR